MRYITRSLNSPTHISCSQTFMTISALRRILLASQAVSWANTTNSMVWWKIKVLVCGTIFHANSWLIRTATLYRHYASMGAVVEATDRAIEDARLVTCKKTILIEPYLALRPSYAILDWRNMAKTGREFILNIGTMYWTLDFWFAVTYNIFHSLKYLQYI